MDLDKFVDSIKKTGFILEHEITVFLEKNGWSVINNKYYVDDVQQSVREIDIIAYRSRNIDGVIVYTSLIISCKKNETEAWALLCREPNFKTPNMNWHPIHYWTNDPISNYQFKIPGHDKKFLPTDDLIDKLFTPKKHVFAFQQMNLASSKVANDKDIYSSITSLLKSQSYEIGALFNRKKTNCVYFFNLISIIDGKLISLECKEDKITPNIINQEQYISNYIINNNPISAKIHFTTKENFLRIIDDYSKLHEHNCKHIRDCYSSFFSNALYIYDKRKIIIETINKNERLKLKYLIREKTKKFLNFNFDDIYMIEESNNIYISLKDISQEEINNHFEKEYIDEFMSETIKKHFRHNPDGSFIYEKELDFNI